MKTSDLLKTEYSSKVVGGFFLVIAIYLFISTEYTNAAIGAFFIGIFALVILHKPTVEEETAISSLECSVRPVVDIVDELELEGPSIAVPTSEYLSEPRTFIPSEDVATVPELYDEIILVPEGLGISLEPTGLPLVKQAKSRMEYDFTGEGIEASRECMGILTHGLNLAKSFSLNKQEVFYRLRITLGRYWNFCEKMRDKHPNICEKSLCPICSAYITIASEGLGSNLKIVDFDIDDRHIKYILEKVR